MKLNLPPKRLKKYAAVALAVILLLLFVIFVLLRPRGQETYLVYGVDQYGSLDESGRSDAMMLVRIDHTHRRIYAVSMARDMLIDNGRGGRTKINTIIRKESEDGSQALIDAIAQNFGVTADGWFRINFSSLVSIVDAMGGVNVTLSAEEAHYIDKNAGLWPGYPLSEGECRLCGGQALWFARCRKLDSDLGRGQRQSRLAAALVREIRRTGIRNIVGLYRSMNHAWRSSLPAAEQAKLVVRALYARRYTVRQLSLPFEDTFRYGSASGIDGILPNLEKNRELLAAALSE
ncbi:MAG: LCP family protein [Clostridia bacterium]|nr:LCP family protein [Clostridia bacterium]